MKIRRTKEKRYNRWNFLSLEEKRQLSETINNTRGMTKYGNRARTAVNMPIDVAIAISRLSHLTGKSVSQIVVDLLNAHLPTLWESIRILEEK